MVHNPYKPLNTLIFHGMSCFCSAWLSVMGNRLGPVLLEVQGGLVMSRSVIVIIEVSICLISRLIVVFEL